MELSFPTLRAISINVDPNVQNEFIYTSKKPYLLIDLDAPEVSKTKVRALARANCTVYEQMVSKYFAGQFQFDSRELSQPEPRTIRFLDTIAGVINPPAYLITLIILEFNA
jgi:hypothetical protein